MLSKSSFFSFCHRQVGNSSSRVAMAKNSQKNFEEELQAGLLNPTKQFELWQRMHSVHGCSPTPRGVVLGAVAPHLILSGTVHHPFLPLVGCFRQDFMERQCGGLPLRCHFLPTPAPPSSNVSSCSVFSRA